MLKDSLDDLEDGSLETLGSGSNILTRVLSLTKMDMQLHLSVMFAYSWVVRLTGDYMTQ